MNLESKVEKSSDEFFLKELNRLANEVTPRAFPQWEDELPIPCGKADPINWWKKGVMRKPGNKGYLFVREMKTGSSTVGGVVLRIARNVAKRVGNDFMCEARIDHSSAMNMEYADRIREESFLFTMIRNPQKRIISQFFHFEVSRGKVEPTDTNFREFLEEKIYLKDYYLRDLALIPAKTPQIMKRTVAQYKALNMNPTKLKELRLRLATDIINGYDFIGISERMDESLVAMMMILRLKISDILYIMKAKSSGGYDDGTHNLTCTYIRPSYVSPGMKKYFHSPGYMSETQGDWMLYLAANKSLDLTIEQLGRSNFEKQLGFFRKAQEVAYSKCAKKIRYPCSESGVRAPFYSHISNATDCLWLDLGCGAKCLDSLEPEIDAIVERG